jgi:hypothetical protein
VFELARKGTTIDTLFRYIKNQGGNPVIMLRRLRSGTNCGNRWRVVESVGKFKVVYPVE